MQTLLLSFKTSFWLVSLVGIEILTEQSITAHLKFFVTLFLGDLSKKRFKEGLKDFNQGTLCCLLFVADQKILRSNRFFVCLLQL